MATRPSPEPVVDAWEKGRKLMRLRRYSLGLTQKQVGRLFTHPHAQNEICRWEAGTNVPNVHSFLEWAAVLDLEVQLVTPN